MQGFFYDLAQIKTKVQVRTIENDVQSSEIELWKQNLERKMTTSEVLIGELQSAIEKWKRRKQEIRI